jgi:Zn-dependent protease with chaperone function
MFVGLAGSLFSVAILCIGISASAQQPKPIDDGPPQRFPFADPQSFFEQLFGHDREVDREALAKVPIARNEESQYGERALQAFQNELKRAKIKVVRRGREVEYLERLVEVVRPHMRNHDRYPKVRVLYAEAPYPEAKCFPGGTLIFFSGLLQHVQSEAAVVGVIGHELSHVDHGHQLEPIRRMKLAQSTFSNRAAFSPDRFFQSGRMLMQTFMRPFRPEDELQADRDGASWAYALGYDPREMAALFLEFNKREPAFRAMMPEFLRTHPYPIDRRDAVMAQYDELQTASPKPDLYVGRENLRRRIPRTVREFAD